MRERNISLALPHQLEPGCLTSFSLHKYSFAQASE